MTDKATRDTINGLVAVCADGVQAFQSALREVDDRDLKQVFYDLSIERRETVAELRKLMHDLGGKPTESGSASGLALRVYADLKAALAGNEEKAILEELERSEDRTLERFETALETALPREAMATLRACQDEILASRRKIDALRARAAEEPS